MSDNVTVIVISGSKNDVFSKLNNIVNADVKAPSYLKKNQERIVKKYINSTSKVFFDDALNRIKRKNCPLPSNRNLSLYLKSVGYTKTVTATSNYWTKD